MADLFVPVLQCLFFITIPLVNVVVILAEIVVLKL